MEARYAPPVITRHVLIDRYAYFVKVQLHPVGRLDPDGWLQNFTPEEEEHALHLLWAFVYLPTRMVRELFVAAFRDISRDVVTAAGPLDLARREWSAFVDSAIFVGVTGEDPNPTDSRYIFLRLARDALGVGEDRVQEPDDALSLLLASPGRPVVFVDDFVGSGSQFVTMWRRPYGLASVSESVSFDQVAAFLPRARFYYCPLVCTEMGRQTIVDHCPRVSLLPAHLIGDEYSALTPRSRVWPEALRPSAMGFLAQVSERAGIPDLNGGVGDWRGFRRLGLTIGFEHGVPDATLPLFTWTQNGWRPLVMPT